MDRREYKQMMEQIRPAPELMERVLAEGQTERSRPMKHRIRAAGVAALAAALLKERDVLLADEVTASQDEGSRP